jgi:hypothetical protein
MYAFFGVLMILGGAFALFVVLSDFAQGETDAGLLMRIYSLLFLIGFIAFGTWLAWPILMACKDLVTGTRHAGEIIRARDSTRASAVGYQFLTFRTALEIFAIAFAGLSPVLWWGMRRREPGSRRPWAVLLAGLATGYIILVHRGVHLLPGSAGADLIERPLRQILAHHEQLLTFGLYWELTWLISLAGFAWTGLPVGNWTAFFAPLALLPPAVGYYFNYPLWKQLLCYLVCIILGGIVNAIRKAEAEAEKAKRALRAREISDRLLGADDGKRPLFALYLRPFASTGHLDTQNVSANADPLDLETVLSYAVRPELSLLGLNRAQEKSIIGADYLYGPDQDWFVRFQELAINAKLLFLLPSARQGTLDEVEWVIEKRALEKCVFIMPETVTGTGWQASSAVPSTVRVYEERIIDHAPEWKETRAAVLQRVNVPLPEYREDGALFMLNARGGVRRLERLGLSHSMWKVLRLRRVIKRVMRPTSVVGG